MFVEKVGRFSPREISRTAKERKAGSMGYAEAMLTFYNKKSTSKSTLKWAKLYESRGTVYDQSLLPAQDQLSPEEDE